MIKKFIRNEKGATAIEYGLIAAGIAVAISVIVFTLGGTIEGKFSDVNDAIAGGGTGGAAAAGG